MNRIHWSVMGCSCDDDDDGFWGVDRSLVYIIEIYNSIQFKLIEISIDTSYELCRFLLVSSWLGAVIALHLSVVKTSEKYPSSLAVPLNFFFHSSRQTSFIKHCLFLYSVLVILFAIFHLPSLFSHKLIFIN